MNKYEKQHQRNLVRYAKQIDEIFEEAAREAARMGVSVENIMERLNKELFAFRDYPMLNERIDALMEKLHDDIEICVLNGVEHEWTLANSKHNELSRRVFGDNIGRLTDAQYQRYFNNHGEALDAFKGRQVAGLNLSDRVWNYTDMFKEQIEAALTVSLGQGKAANCVATELKQYLKYPDKLFRRVKDENGNLVPSKAMAAFHPGQGVYRSSYMNARRLAVTETNIAFRTADHLRIQDEDFVVGIEIVLSNNHTCKGVKGVFIDICDQLKGKYPKDFKFTGWHPHCRCHIETVLKTEAEIDADFEKILKGEEPTGSSVNEIVDTPNNFKVWVSDNKDRILNAKTTPYFVSDNRVYFDAIPQFRNGIDYAPITYNGYKFLVKNGLIQDDVGIRNILMENPKRAQNALSGRLSDITHSVFDYSKKYIRRDIRINALIDEINALDGKDFISQVKKVNQLKKICADMCVEDLKACGAVRGLKFKCVSYNINLTPNEKLITKFKEEVIIPKVKIDGVTFVDKYGMRFTYPIGTDNTNYLFKAGEASSIIKQMPSELRVYIKEIRFVNMRNPTDIFWEKEYETPNFTSLATDGSITTFWKKLYSNKSFYNTMLHESTHELDHIKLITEGNNNIWSQAIKQDQQYLFSIGLNKDMRPTEYSSASIKEDFAESVMKYFTNFEYMKSCFPFRTALIKKILNI